MSPSRGTIEANQWAALQAHRELSRRSSLRGTPERAEHIKDYDKFAALLKEWACYGKIDLALRGISHNLNVPLKEVVEWYRRHWVRAKEKGDTEWLTSPQMSGKSDGKDDSLPLEEKGGTMSKDKQLPSAPPEKPYKLSALLKSAYGKLVGISLGRYEHESQGEEMLVLREDDAWAILEDSGQSNTLEELKGAGVLVSLSEEDAQRAYETIGVCQEDEPSPTLLLVPFDRVEFSVEESSGNSREKTCSDDVLEADPSLAKDYWALVNGRISGVEWRGKYVATHLSEIFQTNSTEKKRRLERASLLEAMSKVETEELFEQIGYNPGKGRWPLAVFVLPPSRVSFVSKGKKDNPTKTHSVKPRDPEPLEDYVDIARQGERHRQGEGAQARKATNQEMEELQRRISELEETVSSLERAFRVLVRLEQEREGATIHRLLKELEEITLSE